MHQLEALGTILTIILGWLFGLLTPMIAERIRRPYRRRDVMRAVIHEMLDLQYVMAWVAFRVRIRKGTVSDAFLDEILPILEEYDGPSADKEILDSVKRAREAPEAERFTATNRPSSAISLRQYSLPLLTSQVVELMICGVEFQRAVLHIRLHLDFFNQLGISAQSQFDKTFSAPTSVNMAIIKQNQEQTYYDAGRRCEVIMRAISELKRNYS